MNFEELTKKGIPLLPSSMKELTTKIKSIKDKSLVEGTFKLPFVIYFIKDESKIECSRRSGEPEMWDGVLTSLATLTEDLNKIEKNNAIWAGYNDSFDKDGVWPLSISPDNRRTAKGNITAHRNIKAEFLLVEKYGNLKKEFWKEMLSRTFSNDPEKFYPFDGPFSLWSNDVPKLMDLEIFRDLSQETKEGLFEYFDIQKLAILSGVSFANIILELNDLLNESEIL